MLEGKVHDVKTRAPNSKNHVKRQNDFVKGILSETLNREEALETFELLDKDKDGNLTVKEIATLFGDDIKGENVTYQST